MIKDIFLRGIFVLLLLLAMLLFADIISFNKYTLTERLAAVFYFLLSAVCISSACRWIIARTRNPYRIQDNPMIKVAALCGVTVVFASLIMAAFTALWLKLSNEAIDWKIIYRSIYICALVVIVFTLVYEILFLSKERMLDTKIVNQLDNERVNAELSVLKNELDPHFIFNSLTTLAHLIHADAGKAYLFNTKLAQVYKYFLINKDRELISLQNELEFIEAYFFLLQIRHDEKLNLNLNLSNQNGETAMILPCALQILVENAIKHNEFSEQEPLKINITLNGEYVHVKNNVKPKLYMVNSTKIGLKNLSDRYKLTCNKDIIIESKNNEFIVKLPLIKQV